MFKIGSCYKQRNGELVKLFLATCADREGRALVHARSVGEDLGYGHRLADSGREWDLNMLPHNRDLLPQEYDERGNPIPEQAPATTLGALLRQALEPKALVKRVSRTAEPQRSRLTWADPASTDRFPGYVVTRGCTEQPQPAGFVSTDLQPASAQVTPAFGSAALLKG